MTKLSEAVTILPQQFKEKPQIVLSKWQNINFLFICLFKTFVARTEPRGF